MAVEQGIKDVGNFTARQILKHNRFFSHWLILGIALIAIGSLTGLNIFLEYERTQSREQTRLLAQSRVLQENIGQNLIATRDVLVGLRRYLPKGKADKDLITRLQILTDALPGVRTISIIDASGTWRASNRQEYIGKNFKYRDYFKVPHKQPKENMLYITPPYRSQLGSLTISVSVIITGSKGEFAGVVMAALDPSYFAPIMESVLYAPDMWVAIDHWEGILFMIRPEIKGLAGKKIRPGYLHRENGKELTVHSGTGNITGDDRLLVARTVRPADLTIPTPLVVIASRNRSAIFANWRKDSLMFAALYGIIVIASIMGLYVFQRRQRQFNRQAAESANALKQSEERFRSFVENANDIIYSLNPDGVFTYVSPNWTEVLGHDTSEVMGRNFEIFVHPDDLARLRAFLEKAIVTEEKQAGIEYRVLHKNGTWRWHTSNAAIIRNTDENTVSFLGIARDITDRKQAEEKLVLFAGELERSNKELDDFAYIASHDLKEPLRGIHNYSAFLLEDYANRLDDDGKDKLNTLVYLTKRLERFINNLLEFSRLGRVKLTMSEVAVDETLKDALALINPLIEKEQVSIRLPRPLPTVTCDHYQIVEVFQNLISNAVNYNDKQDKWVEIGYTESNILTGKNGTDEKTVAEDNYIFYVRDNGIGIDKKYFASIFTLFKRLHGRDKFGGGTGAGLTIVKKIIERHGGKIWLESIPAEGTTFYFTLAGEKK
jgi:PAS domain S-box-containing protein